MQKYVSLFLPFFFFFSLLRFQSFFVKGFLALLLRGCFSLSPCLSEELDSTDFLQSRAIPLFSEGNEPIQVLTVKEDNNITPGANSLFKLATAMSPWSESPGESFHTQRSETVAQQGVYICKFRDEESAYSTQAGMESREKTVEETWRLHFALFPWNGC